MSKIKSHKSVEQIAKKHGVDVSFIKNQLKMGIPIEHEHTNNKDLAKDIALQHLAEIPDYYTRLKKMEKTSKKIKTEEMEFNDLPISQSGEKRYCPKCKKEETRSECAYGVKYWDLFSLPSKLKEEKRSALVDKILSELKEENPCWKGYTQVGMKLKKGRKVPNCVPDKGVSKARGYKKEDVTLQDANGNTFVEIVDLIKPEPIKGFKSQIKEASRLQAQTGNIMAVMLTWRGKYYCIKMFFPQVSLPTRKDINFELQKIYPGSNVLHYSVSELQQGQPLVQFGTQGGSFAKPGPNKNYVKPMGEEIEIQERVKLDKSKMKCNKPIAQAVGDSLTGKSHVVKACEGGEEKIIRFGQRGVKGSPKKKGESKEYANRRKRFKARHRKNIAKGKKSAAYWANKVKW